MRLASLRQLLSCIVDGTLLAAVTGLLASAGCLPRLAACFPELLATDRWVRRGPLASFGCFPPPISLAKHCVLMFPLLPPWRIAYSKWTLCAGAHACVPWEIEIWFPEIMSGNRSALSI